MSAEISESEKKAPTKYKDMLIDALTSLPSNKRKGISKVAIVNYVQEKYDKQNVNGSLNRYIGNALTSCLTSGRIERIKGSFRLVQVARKTSTKKTTEPVDKENVKPSKPVPGKKAKTEETVKSKTATNTSETSTNNSSSKVDADTSKPKNNSNKVKPKGLSMSDNEDMNKEVPKKTMKKTMSLTKLKAKPNQKKTVAPIEKPLPNAKDSTDESNTDESTTKKVKPRAKRATNKTTKTSGKKT